MSDESRKLEQYKAIADLANDHALEVDAKLYIAIRCLKKMASYSPIVESVKDNPIKALRELQKLAIETLYEIQK
jgi:hypothetical protein